MRIFYRCFSYRNYPTSWDAKPSIRAPGLGAIVLWADWLSEVSGRKSAAQVSCRSAARPTFDRRAEQYGLLANGDCPDAQSIKRQRIASGCRYIDRYDVGISSGIFYRSPKGA